MVEILCMCRGRINLVLLYLVPSLLFAVLFNIPRLISSSSYGSTLQHNMQFVHFYVLYQVNSVSAPCFLLVCL